MPYSGASDDPNLPKNVKTATAKKRRQWQHVWNGEYATHGDESRAFATANSVLDKATGRAPKAKQQDATYMDEVGEGDERTVYHKATPEAAGYSATGANGGHGCISCIFFDGSDGCAVVAGPISPLGMSKLYVQATDTSCASDPIGVDDDDDAPSIGTRESVIGQLTMAVQGKLKSLFSPPNGGASIPRNLTFFKDMQTGRLRYIAVFSNNFKDREGETITEEAHREYITWADKTGIYPEAWLWHAGSKSRWGQSDMVDYCDGFIVTSGLVDEGKEGVAASLREDGEHTAVSHGFLASKADSRGYVHKYRTFEWSPLPDWAAANEWTGYSIENDGSITSMPFDDKKIAWLKGKGATDASLKEFEASLSNIAQHLQARGIDYKDLSSFFPQGKDNMQPADTGGDTNPSVANPAGIHHPHLDNLTHYHYHMDGTYHEHAHTHNDGSTGHDTDAHSAMSGKSLVEHIAVVKAARTMLGLKEVTNANKTKPEEYSSVPDDKFLDKENWKYPYDESHIKAAHSYFNHAGQREAGGYSESQWASMGGKLASALGSGYKYENGQVIQSDKSLDIKGGDGSLMAMIVANNKSIADLTSAVAMLATKVAGGTPLETAPAPTPPVRTQAQTPPGDAADMDFVRFFNNEAAKASDGFRATESNGNVVRGAVDDLGRKALNGADGDGWFQDMVLNGAKAAMGN